MMRPGMLACFKELPNPGQILRPSFMKLVVRGEILMTQFVHKRPLHLVSRESRQTKVADDQEDDDPGSDSDESLPAATFTPGHCFSIRAVWGFI